MIDKIAKQHGVPHFKAAEHAALIEALVELVGLPMSAQRGSSTQVFSQPPLQRPEGVAVHPDGWLWRGGEEGEILRVGPDASRDRNRRQGGEVSRLFASDRDPCALLLRQQGSA